MLLLALVVSTSAPAYAAKAVKVVQALSPEIVGHAHVVATEMVIGDTAKAAFAKLEAKAAGKRIEAKLPVVDPAAPMPVRPAAESYPTLPLAQMAPLEIEDVTRDWGLVTGRPVKLTITIDTIRTADAAAAMFLGSADELAGDVVVSDPADGKRLGEFYLDVLNYQAGLLKLAMRGAGVREKMVATLAQLISQQLSGSKHKPTAPTTT